METTQAKVAATDDALRIIVVFTAVAGIGLSVLGEKTDYRCGGSIGFTVVLRLQKQRGAVHQFPIQLIQP